ncbi:MAG: hypothetical protein U9O94_05885 [Nanoarchaeota archaeon]|nr:hypothetical protein [Nanoarchaeota archaeon]
MNNLQINPNAPMQSNRFNPNSYAAMPSTGSSRYNWMQNMSLAPSAPEYIPNTSEVMGGQPGPTLSNLGQPGYPSLNTGKGRDSIFGLDTLNMAGNVMGGVGSLAKGWAALKGIGIAENELAENKRQYDQNYAAQRTTVNNQIRDRQAMLNSAFYNDPARAAALQVVR